MTEIGVEGMMVSPGYNYEKAPDQDHFLKRRKTVDLFRRLLDNASRRWKFNQSPLFLLFLQGKWDLECTPWGNPTYNIFGWQKPCYLMQEGYAATFQELIDSTEWENYGRQSGNPKCADCMVHSGYEPSAVAETFGTLRGFAQTVRMVLFGAPADRTPFDPTDRPGRSVVQRLDEEHPFPGPVEADRELATTYQLPIVTR
jgi:hypothetical protein